jgi:hypothetical protein
MLSLAAMKCRTLTTLFHPSAAKDGTPLWAVERVAQLVSISRLRLGWNDGMWRTLNQWGLFPLFWINQNPQRQRVRRVYTTASRNTPKRFLHNTPAQHVSCLGRRGSRPSACGPFSGVSGALVQRPEPLREVRCQALPTPFLHTKVDGFPKEGPVHDLIQQCKPNIQCSHNVRQVLF